MAKFNIRVSVCEDYPTGYHEVEGVPFEFEGVKFFYKKGKGFSNNLDIIHTQTGLRAHFCHGVRPSVGVAQRELQKFVDKIGKTKFENGLRLGLANHGEAPKCGN